MHSKKYLAIFTIFFIIIYGLVKVPSTGRAASDSDQIPSDLALDLDLAQKDPAPQQKQIIQFQTSQAKIVTDKGEQVVVVVKDEVPAEVKLQSARDALNPEQTTSEQVVNKTVETDQDQSAPVASGSPSDGNGNNPVPASSGNVIPGTDILEPDDNTAPLPPSSVNPSVNSSEAPQNPSISPSPQATVDNQTNPQGAPSETGSDNSIKPSGSPLQPDTAPSPPNSDTQQPANTTNTIPPENGVTQDTNPQPQSNDSSGDTSAVQGVSTGPNISWWQQLLNKVIGILKR